MKTLGRRLQRLEDHFVSADRPQRRLRLVVCMAGARPSLEGAMCRRSLCADGTLLELVKYANHNDEPAAVADEQIDAWVDEFPIHDLRTP
jgi:hypothetical protein